MTHEELDNLWQQAMFDSVKRDEMYIRYAFAALVAAAEREACAKVCDALPFLTAEQCATAIRARGEEK